MKKGKILGIVFSNGNDESMHELTQSRAMGSVPFCGRYRMIDFMLSNMLASKMNDVIIIVKENYFTLMEHIGSGREWDLARKNGGVHVVAPFSSQDNIVYEGRMQGLSNTLNYVKNSDAEYILVTTCDKIYNSDFLGMVETHKEKQADITLLYKMCNSKNLNMNYISTLTFNEENRADSIMIKPDIDGDVNVYLNVALMKRDFFIKLVKKSFSEGANYFERDVLQRNLDSLKVFGHKYDDDVYFINSLKQYYNATMSLLNRQNMQNIFKPKKPIYTKVRDEVPAKYGLESIVKNSLIADGCIIEGTVENSVLFRGVHVKKGAVIKDSIIMQATVVGAKATVNYAIVDKKSDIIDYHSVNGTIDHPIYIPRESTV